MFTSGVVRTCIDQNWDLKGFKSVLLRVLKELGQQDTETGKLKEFFEKLIQSQNLQSQSCIKAISHFLKNAKKEIQKDDLANPVLSFQTSFEFVRADIERYRAQNMKYECFQVLHPWAYDLDQVDFKYVINKDQTHNVCRALTDPVVQVFWLSAFKSQLAVSADEFVAALKEYCVMNLIPEHFDAHFEAELKPLMLASDFAVSVADHAALITKHVKLAHAEAARRYSGCSLLNGDQLRFAGTSARAKAGKSEYLSEERLAQSFKLGDVPFFEVMKVGQIKAWHLTEAQSLQKLDMRRVTFQVLPNAV